VAAALTGGGTPVQLEGGQPKVTEALAGADAKALAAPTDSAEEAAAALGLCTRMCAHAGCSPARWRLTQAELRPLRVLPCQL